MVLHYQSMPKPFNNWLQPPFVPHVPNLCNKCLALCAVSGRTHVGVCMRARRLEVSRAFLRQSQPESLTQGLSLNTVINTTRLADDTAVPNFYVSAGCSNSGPPAYEAGAYQLNHHLTPF